MKNKKVQNDRRFDKKMRYFQLIVDRFEIENKLWHEYPDEMSDSTIKLAEKMLKIGLIKCKHENNKFAKK